MQLLNSNILLFRIPEMDLRRRRNNHKNLEIGARIEDLIRKLVTVEAVGHTFRKLRREKVYDHRSFFLPVQCC